MVGLILIYFTGKAFANLAEEYNKGKWLYGFLGVFSYYGGLLFTGATFGVLMELGHLNFLRDVNETLLGVICIPFGVLICWAFYKYLKNKWINTDENNKSNSVLLDD